MATKKQAPPEPDDVLRRMLSMPHKDHAPLKRRRAKRKTTKARK